MDSDLQHQDLLIKLRSKLNEDKIKLWEPPYIQVGEHITQNLQDLAKNYAVELNSNYDTVLEALQGLQKHSVERSKANEDFKETGVATLRVKATLPGKKPVVVNILKKLDVSGSELIEAVSNAVEIPQSRIKLIYNGKILKPSSSIGEQGIKNGIELMALIMAETAEVSKKQDTMYMEMKNTRDDAALLSEYVDEMDDDDDYMKLEDQSGSAVELPTQERRSLMVGLTLHERGRAAIKDENYTLALVLLLEADRLFSECSASILSRVDNWAVLQLDIVWCYVKLQSLQHAADATKRLEAARNAFRNTYGEQHERLIALKGTNANERYLFMRLYLLQGVVTYHQNRRDEAKRFLDKAETEMNALKVCPTSEKTLTSKGWGVSAARAALRAAAGDLELAQQRLLDRANNRDLNNISRQNRRLGLCTDGTPVSQQLVEALISMGFTKNLSIVALRNSNNNVADAVRLIQEERHLLDESDFSSDETDTPSSEHSLVEPDEKLAIDLAAMGYDIEDAKAALRKSGNNVEAAIDILHEDDPSNPSTSAGGAKNKSKQERKKRKKERKAAFERLTSAINTEDDDYLDSSLTQEQEIITQYKSLL